MDKLNAKVKEIVGEYLDSKGWERDEENYSEAIRYGKEVYSKIGEAHRWYDEEFRVVEVDGYLIGFNDFHTTGDMSAADMDLDFDWESVSLVEKRETVSYEYVKID